MSFNLSATQVQTFQNTNAVFLNNTRLFSALKRHFSVLIQRRASALNGVCTHILTKMMQFFAKVYYLS